MHLGSRKGLRFGSSDAARARGKGNRIYHGKDHAGSFGQSGRLRFEGSEGTILLFAEGHTGRHCKRVVRASERKNIWQKEKRKRLFNGASAEPGA